VQPISRIAAAAVSLPQGSMRSNANPFRSTKSPLALHFFSLYHKEKGNGTENLQIKDKRGEIHERRLPAPPHLPHARLYILGRAFHTVIQKRNI